MPYHHIKQPQIQQAVAIGVGKLQSIAIQQAQTKILELQEELTSAACPGIQKLEQLQRKKSNIQNTLKSVQGKMSKFQSIPNSLRGPVRAIEAAVNIILKIPIPQSVPPGFGIPINITNKFGELETKLREIIASIKDAIDAISAIILVPSLIIGNILTMMSRFDFPIISCNTEGQLQKALDNGEVTEAKLRDLGLYDDQGFTLSRLNNEFVGTVNSSILNGSQRNFELSEEGQRLLAEGKLKGAYNLDDEDSKRRNAIQTLNNALDNLGFLNDDLKKSLSDLTNQFRDQSKEELALSDYKANSGKVYSFRIETDPKGSDVAPRRFAVGLDQQGVAIIKGPPSYASDTQVLIDEVIFRIENQLP
jgi:hypothetical protein